MTSSTRPRLLRPTVLLLALAAAAAQAAPGVERGDSDGFALTGCTGGQAQPGAEDPQTLMRLLRARGLADAPVRLNGTPVSSATLTPIGARKRCEGAPASAGLRRSTATPDDAVSTSHLASRVPMPGTPVASSR